MHAFDAQEAAGRDEPLPAAIAADSVDEFLTVSLGSSGPWPHQPARIALRASAGPQWLVDLSEKGAVVVTDGAEQDSGAWLAGRASDLLLVLYARLGLDAVQVGGDRALVRQLIDWAPRD